MKTRVFPFSSGLLKTMVLFVPFGPEPVDTLYPILIHCFFDASKSRSTVPSGQERQGLVFMGNICGAGAGRWA